jgi:phosphoglycolate phosphatase
VSPVDPRVVVFDLDGTLFDSAPGIVAGFAHALRSVGFPPPSEAVLRSDLGPPVDLLFRSLGVPPSDLAAAVATYREYYLTTGLLNSRPYAGTREVLQLLQAVGITLATATAKRTDVARAIVQHHGWSDFFAVLNGVDDQHQTKTATLSRTLELLGGPRPDRVLMVGDRHSDISAAQSCGVHAVGVTWGYGTSAELTSTGARLVDRPAQVLKVVAAVLEVPGLVEKPWQDPVAVAARPA